MSVVSGFEDKPSSVKDKVDSVSRNESVERGLGWLYGVPASRQGEEWKNWKKRFSGVEKEVGRELSMELLSISSDSKDEARQARLACWWRILLETDTLRYLSSSMLKGWFHYHWRREQDQLGEDFWQVLERDDGARAIWRNSELGVFARHMTWEGEGSSWWLKTWKKYVLGHHDNDAMNPYLVLLMGFEGPGGSVVNDEARRTLFWKFWSREMRFMEETGLSDAHMALQQAALFKLYLDHYPVAVDEIKAHPPLGLAQAQENRVKPGCSRAQALDIAQLYLDWNAQNVFEEVTPNGAVPAEIVWLAHLRERLRSQESAQRLSESWESRANIEADALPLEGRASLASPRRSRF